MSNTLEKKALAGGMILIGRQFFGIVLSLVGMLVTTRLLGPQKYGQFAIVSGLMQYAASLGRMGLDTYLIRHQEDLRQDQIAVTQGLYLVIGVIITIIVLILGPVASLWYKDPFLKELFWVFALIVPIILLNNVPIAILDRRLDYKQAAMTELAGQLTYLAISVPIVWFNRSVWGLILGIFGQSLLTLVLASFWSRVSFNPRFDWQEAKEQLRYGTSYATSIWIWQVRDLVNPLVVGKLLGAEAVAYVAMAIRLATLAGFAKTAVWRVYMSYLARIGYDRNKMRETVEAGLSQQVLILGVTFICFMAASPELVGGVMGERWLPLLQVLPFIAAGLIVNGGFSLHSSALYVVGMNNQVSLFHIIHVILFVAGAVLFVPFTRNIAGYGWAEVAAFASYFWIRRALHRNLFPIRERLLYFNLGFVLGSLVLLANLLQSALVVRFSVAFAALALLLLAVSKNREAALVIWEKLNERFRLRSA
jgi:O-antigen/teichoic acid export membrane protein